MCYGVAGGVCAAPAAPPAAVPQLPATSCVDVPAAFAALIFVGWGECTSTVPPAASSLSLSVAEFCTLPAQTTCTICACCWTT